MKNGLMANGLAVIALLTTLPGHAGPISIDYNKDEQLLAVTAEQASLTEILKQISAKTGIAVRIDPTMERTTSFAIKSAPVDKVLSRVTRNLSYVLKYEKKNDKHIVVSLDVLPKGKEDSGQLITIQNTFLPDDITPYQGSVDGGPLRNLQQPTQQSNRSTLKTNDPSIQPARGDSTAQTEIPSQVTPQQLTTQPPKAPVNPDIY